MRRLLFVSLFLLGLAVLSLPVAALAATQGWRAHSRPAQQLDKALYGAKGSLSGDGHFTISMVNGTSLKGQDWLCFRPALPKSKKYQDGWPGGILMDLLGSPY